MSISARFYGLLLKMYREQNKESFSKKNMPIDFVQIYESIVFHSEP